MNILRTAFGITFGIMLVSQLTFAQKSVTPATHTTAWQKEWKQADSLSDQGLPKSAMEIVDRIYSASKSGKDIPQYIKAVIYRIKLNSFFREDFLVGTIADLEAETRQAGEPTKQILRSILGEVYAKYYQNNEYRFNGRTRVEGVKTDSILTWDLNTIMQVIYGNYLASLQNETLLKSTSILDYRDIIEVAGSGYSGKTTKTDVDKAVIFRPTLYDFLANRALDFFTSSEGPKNTRANGFRMDNASWFASGDQFIKTPIRSNDSLSQDLQSIKIYQALAAIHMNDKNPAALIESELARFAFVKDKAITANNDSLYLSALKTLENRYKDSPYSGNVSFAIAKFYQEQGNTKPGDPAHRFDLKNALSVCESAIKRFPGSEGAANCQILAETLHNPEIEIRNEAVVSPGNPSLLLIRYNNLKTVYLRLFRLEQSSWEPKKEKLKKEQLIKFLATQQVSRTWAEILPDYGDYRNHSAETSLPPTIAGFYVILACSDSSFSASSKLITWSDYTVSSFNYTSKHNRNGSISLYIFNREDGLPMRGISVESWVKSYNYQSREWESHKTGNYSSDNSGFVTLHPVEKGEKFNNLYCKLVYAEDILYTVNFYQYPLAEPVEKTVKQTTFFTDRGIYRPGQTVYFKGIILEKKGEHLRLLTQEPTKVVFTDVNGRKISEQNFTSNEFGSFHGSFIAPQDVLPGSMRISNESGSISFSVEQYKRPTFEVSIDPLEGSYKLNEPLTIKGKAMAYAGNAISGATVKYRVVRGARFPWWERWFMPFPSSPETEITNGSATSSVDGTFSFVFNAIPDFSVQKSSDPVFDFRITLDVTDVNGETQSLEKSVSVGYKSLILGIHAGDKLNLQADTLISFRPVNLNDRPTPVKAEINLSKLKVPGKVFLKRYWDRPDTSLIPETQFREDFPHFSYGSESDTLSWPHDLNIVKKTIDLASDSILNIKRIVDLAGKLKQLEPGVYELVLSADDSFGEKVSAKRYFTVYDPGSATLAGSPMNWFVALKTNAKPGENAGFLIGSKEKNVSMMYEIYAGDSLLSRKYVSISNFQMQLDFPVLESYRGNFSVNFLFSKFNRIFQNSQLIAVPYADNKLNIVFETFRSKILPGQKEEWKIRITGTDKKPVSAEFLASMYDASLDAFGANPWSFYISQKYFGSNPWDISSNASVRSGSMSANLPSTAFTEHQYPGLNWFGMNYFGMRQYPMMFKSGRMDNSGISGERPGMAILHEDNTGAMPSQEVVSVAGVTVPPEEKKKPSTVEPVIQIRRDFRETAFFYPDLVTDSTGGISISFTAPESLTRWKFQGFAHTVNLDYNLVEKELVTRKDLMVMPNAPRFVRQGDKLVFSTRVVNLSEHEMKAVVRIGLVDGISMKPLDSLVSGQLKQEVTIPQGESVAVTWNILIPGNSLLSLLQYRITAEAGAYSDGEEKIIPVLPNRMMVTESLPLPVRDKGTFDFSFDKLLSSSADNTLKNFRLTLEFASNPAWYAIQALPALNDKTYDDAYSTFGAFYSNSIASHIMNSDPKIKTVFESWKNLTPDALLSNLEKNQQLKSVLLQQTPWVMEAKNESDNRSRLGMYFDPDNLRMNLQKNLNRLQKLQTPGGGFTWFDGMPESRFISQDIIGGLAHLKHLGVSVSAGDQQLSKMLTKGLRYMDEAFRLNYDELKRRYPTGMKDNNLNILEIQYLYTRSYFLQDQPMPANTTEALNYWISQATQFWMKEGLSSQAMLSLALERFGKKDVSALIIRSLTERALHSPEMGMYWAQEQGWYWQQAPVETQSALIEAFDEVGKDKKAVEEMKIWLLKQKQTQSWTSTRATVEACYALLLRGTSLLTEDPKIKISLGKIKVDPSKLSDVKQEAGTGYFTMSWSGSEITPDMGKVKVSKGSDGVAWGALYWQYFENMDKITKASTSLKLEKKLFLETNTPSVPVLQPVSDNSSLKPGDKLKVRIVLTTDRNLEFVHMGDQRASAFEPGAGSTLSGYHYQDGLGYYQSTTDVSTDFFFYYIPKGTYVFEYPLLVNAAGDYSNGITTIQCLYAPEFSAHSEGIRVQVK